MRRKVNSTQGRGKHKPFFNKRMKGNKGKKMYDLESLEKLNVKNKS